MAKLIDLTGQKFDKLTVLQKADSINRHTAWLCKCDCGNKTIIRGDYLTKKRKGTLDCGCSKIDTNIGKKFNKLTVLSINEEYSIEQLKNSKKKRKYYNCLCDCGKKCIKRADSVINGHVQSCGCKHLMQASELGKSRLIDLTGQKFGKLTVLKFDKSINGCPKWICECECGNIVSVYGNNLTRLHTTSCGCINFYIGEHNIEEVLKLNNIKYIKEYSFKDLKDKGLLRFDFAIFSNNELIELIEFDGRQHMLEYKTWNSKDKLEDRIRRDQLKNEYCLKNNIKLIRIPYSKRDNITLELLELKEESDHGK